MSINRFGSLVVAAFFILLVGCGKQQSDKRLIELAVNQQKQQEEVARLAARIEGIERKLDDALKAAAPQPSSPGSTESAKSAERKPVDFRQTPEYGRIVAALSAIQRELNLAQSQPREPRGESPNALESQRQAAPFPPLDDRIEATRNPEEMRKRLNSLAETFAQKITDPIQRQQFLADIEQLKQINTEGLTPEELRGALLGMLQGRLGTEENPSIRKWLELQVAHLQSASPEDLGKATERIRGTENLTRLGQIRERYEIPPATMEEAGFPGAEMHFTVFETASGAVAGVTVISPSIPLNESVPGEPMQIRGEQLRIELKTPGSAPAHGEQ